MKTLREDGRTCCSLRTNTPWPALGVYSLPHEAGLRKMLCQKLSKEGVRQIVILGAGLDTFALRSPHGARQIRIYEVDHPATQAWKRQRLAEAQLAGTAAGCLKVSP